MKIGDLVKMDFESWPAGDEWGVGMIVDIEHSQATLGCTDVVVLWSGIGDTGIGDISWEMPDMLELIYETR